MASTRISEQLPPMLDPTKAPVAFGNRALPRLSMELQDPDLYTRQRALAALCALVHNPERAYEAVEKGILERLKVLLKDKDSYVRTKTTEVIYLMVTHNVGRDAFLKYDMVGPLSELLNEPVDVCRINVHRALKMLAQFPAGATCIVGQGLVTQLVTKVPMEEEEIRAILLETLSCLVRVDAMPALHSDGVATLKEQLQSLSLPIRRAAASAMLGISVPTDGKQRVCDEGVLPILVDLLSDDDAEVWASAAGTIMNTAVITKGKYEALKAGAIPALLHLVQCEERAVCVNALRALTCLAEAPVARVELMEHLPLLRICLSHKEPIIQRAADTAIRVISWKP
ncbi:radial spoke head 14 homolog [Engraulis encrasicolus]|uniref:radial spoke head 14 homolog n=1 Tax=Engraulis encrasicolus TaxID=184585 RepID=UPI002FD103C0